MLELYRGNLRVAQSSLQITLAIRGGLDPGILWCSVFYLHSKYLVGFSADPGGAGRVLFAWSGASNDGRRRGIGGAAAGRGGRPAPSRFQTGVFG
ncbi:MAG TPA: hypothetical protein DCF63_18705 [Planctomycetaceae bacterium]|nr:hypothetical protein [Planctomycetaceae bacterium]